MLADELAHVAQPGQLLDPQVVLARQLGHLYAESAQRLSLDRSAAEVLAELAPRDAQQPGDGLRLACSTESSSAGECLCECLSGQVDRDLDIEATPDEESEDILGMRLVERREATRFGQGKWSTPAYQWVTNHPHHVRSVPEGPTFVTPPLIAARPLPIPNGQRPFI